MRNREWRMLKRRSFHYAMMTLEAMKRPGIRCMEFDFRNDKSNSREASVVQIRISEYELKSNYVDCYLLGFWFFRAVCRDATKMETSSWLSFRASSTS